MLNPKKSLFDDNGNPRPALTKTLDTVLRVQRPLALSMVKSLRSAHPDETPEKILRRLERNYLRDVTAIGGVTGASAFVPGIGTVTSMGLSALAVGGYLERTALFAQAVAELHGVHVENPEVARSMVMAIMLGEEGSQLMNTVLLQTGKASGVSNRWGMLLGGKSAGKTFSVERTVRNMFIKRFLTRQAEPCWGVPCRSAWVRWSAAAQTWRWGVTWLRAPVMRLVMLPRFSQMIWHLLRVPPSSHLMSRKTPTDPRLRGH